MEVKKVKAKEDGGGGGRERERERTEQNITEYFIYTRNFFNYSELFSEKAALKTITLIIKYVPYTNIYIEVSYKYEYYILLETECE